MAACEMSKILLAGVALVLGPGAWGGPTADRQLVWQDEFAGPALDTNKWCMVSTMGAADHLYVNDARTVEVSDGLLRLHVRPSPDPEKACMLSHGVTTKSTMAWRYGYLEMRARVPFRRGSWPSFWMLSTPGLRQAP